MKSKCKPVKYISVKEYFSDKGKSFKEAVKSLKEKPENFKEDYEIKSDSFNYWLDSGKDLAKYKEWCSVQTSIDCGKDTIKPFAYNSEDLKNFELGDMIYEVIQNNRLQFLKEVDLAIKEYFLYKYNRDIDELIRISKNVNNFKIKDRFHKVSTLSEMKDCYYDGDYCYLTTSQGYGNGYVVKHWLEK